MNNLHSKHVLVTGAAGFIGANLVRELLQHGATVHALVRPGTKLWRIADIIPSLNLHIVDLTNRADLQRAVNQIKPEIVFHLAVPSGYPSQPQARVDMLQTSVLGTANLLEAITPIDFHRFVHFGSSLEYGPRNKPLKESDRLEPLTFRGVAKAAATLLCQQFARANRRPVVVLRPFLVYGYWESPARLIPTAIRVALRNEEIDLTAPGYRRDFIFVKDVVESCLLAVQAERVAGEIINVGSGQQRSNEEVVEMVQAVSGQKVRVRVGAYPPRPADTPHWVADIRKAKKLLGWEPRHTLRSGLEKTIAWVRQHLDVYDAFMQDNR
ncbi:MAG: NAD-dependent epimerase/dehydratase family protein [Chloroflexota bacterium]